MSKSIFEKLGIDLSKADGDTKGLLRGFITEYAKKYKEI